MKPGTKNDGFYEEFAEQRRKLLDKSYPREQNNIAAENVP